MSDRKPLWRRFVDGVTEIHEASKAGPDLDPKATMALNAALKYAALRGLSEPPRNAEGGLGGADLASWFEGLVVFAESDSSEHARHFLDDFEAIEAMPESA